MKKINWHTLALIGFFISRLYVFLNPPPFYSDVFHDYRRYAGMWAEGHTPYLKHFYEYPPATIPLLYAPQFAMDSGVGHYYSNYRTMTLILDLIIFSAILKVLQKLKTSQIQKNLSLAFYLIAPMISKDFFYEGIDLVFIGSLVIGLFYLLKTQKSFLNRFWFWFFFWLSTSLKFLSAPLLAVYLYLTNFKLFKELKSFILGFLAIWALPLAIFRSSLAVMFVFHTQRKLKYASFSSFMVETINYWTKSETRVNKPPDFQLQGPVSAIAEKIVEIVFPLSILLVLIYGLIIVLKPNLKNIKASLNKLFLLKKPNLSHLDPYQFSLKLALIYILTIFLTGKVFSQPFHIWFIPIIALFPFKTLKKQLIFTSLVLWLLIIDTTPWLNFINEATIIIDPIPAKFFIYLARFLPMFILLFLSFKLENKNEA